jgi:hypothetical protein
MFFVAIQCPGQRNYYILRLMITEKTAVSLILAPYLINIRKLPFDNASSIINSWLGKCGKLRQLDQNFDYTVRYALKNSIKNGYRPLKLETLKLKNNSLYALLLPKHLITSD